MLKQYLEFKYRDKLCMNKTLKEIIIIIIIIIIIRRRNDLKCEVKSLWVCNKLHVIPLIIAALRTVQ